MVRFGTLLLFYGSENFPGLSRNGPLILEGPPRFWEEEYGVIFPLAADN